VVVVFALLWLPIHLVLLFVHFLGPPKGAVWFDAVYVLCTGLAYFNSCVNPIIYNRTSKDFRDAFRAAVFCQKPVKGDGDSATPLRAAGRSTAGQRSGGTRTKLTTFVAEDAACADGKIHVEKLS